MDCRNKLSAAFVKLTKINKMKKEDLRKVEFSVYSETEFKFNTYKGYFHTWGKTIKEIQTPLSEDFYGIKKVVVDVAIIEEQETGDVFLVDPNNVTFLN